MSVAERGHIMAKTGKVHLLILTACLLSWSSVASAGSVTLAWERVADTSVEGYNIYWGTQSGVYTAGSAVIGNTTTITVNGLTDNSAYYFVVRTRTFLGALSGPSIEVSRRVGVPHATAGDITGDFLSDIGVFRPSDGTWYFRTGGTATLRWGIAIDIPAAGDYDGDGKV